MITKLKGSASVPILKGVGIVLLLTELVTNAFIYNPFNGGIYKVLGIFIILGYAYLDLYGLNVIIKEQIIQAHKYKEGKLLEILMFSVGMICILIIGMININDCSTYLDPNIYNKCIQINKNEMFVSFGTLGLFIALKLFIYLFFWSYHRKLENNQCIEAPAIDDIKISCPTFVYDALPENASSKK